MEIPGLRNVVGHHYFVPAWLFFLLAVFGGDNFLHAQAEPHVLLVTESKPTSADGRVFRRDLLKISKNGKEKIAALTDFLIFGKDESNVVILDGHCQDQSDEWRANDWDIWVVDRQTSKLVAQATLHDFPAQRWINDCEPKLAVRSQDSMACIPTYDVKLGGRGYGFADVNWKGEVHLNLTAYKGKVAGMTDLSPIPPGFAVFCNDWAGTTHVVEPMVALYEAATQKFRLVAPQSKGGNDWSSSQLASDQLVFVPTVGLVHYHRGALFRLSEASLKTDIPVPEGIPISNVHSRIFACLVRGKPRLLWGENAHVPADFGKISEIVVYDWNSKRELWRKSLATTTSSFQMNRDGSRLYFLAVEQEKISFLDIESREIRVFFEIGPIAPQGPHGITYGGQSFRTILDAY